MGKTIAIRGKEKGDFPYYIAKSLAGNNFTVACIDNSYAKDLFESIHQYENDGMNFVEKENIVFIKDAVVDSEFVEKFDFVIFYLGENTRHLTTDFSIIVTGFSFVDINKTLEINEEILEDSYFILRDMVSKKITEKSVAHQLNIRSEQIVGSIPLDIKDEAGYQNLTYEGRTRIKELSQDMQYAVMSVLAIATGDDLKTIKKYYRKAKRNMRF